MKTRQPTKNDQLLDGNKAGSTETVGESKNLGRVVQSPIKLTQG